MATITTSKDKAIKRIQDKVVEGQMLLKKLSDDVNKSDYDNVLNDHETWRTSCFNTLRQIFSDEVLASKFLGDEDGYPTDESFSQQLASLKSDIKTDVKKLLHTIDDLNDNLYSQGGDKEIKVAKLSLMTTIIVALITAIGGIVAGYVALPHKPDPLAIQGLDNVSLEGKWKYICTSFDGSYQHGGRFTVQKQKDGSLILNGERIWSDTKDTLNNWICKTYPESEYLHWFTNWIFVKDDSKMNFEYVIPMQDRTVTGYCTGIIDAEDKQVKSVKGNFYVLNDTPILTGQIIFRKVTDEDYNSGSTLSKNH